MSASWSRPTWSPISIIGTTSARRAIPRQREPMGAVLLRLVRLSCYMSLTLPLMPVQALLVASGSAWARRLPRLYHRWCCRIMGFRVAVHGESSALRPTLFVANHVSYVDIEILGGVIEGSFIAKAEVARWPLFGWLARLQRTVFVDRRVRSTAAQRDAIPMGRAYRPFFAWYGDMTLAPHLWTMLGLGTAEVAVTFHPPVTLAEFGSRKALAEHCHRVVAAGMASALAGRAQAPEPDGEPLPATKPAREAAE